MGKVIMSGIVPLLTAPRSMPKASLTPKGSVIYYLGFDTSNPADLSLYAEAISNLEGVSNDTTTIYLDWGSRHCEIIIGDANAGQLTISLNGTDYLFDIIGFNHDDLTDANAYGKATKTGKAGLTLQMHDLFATTYPMNNSQTNTGGWKSSLMRTSTMPLMKGYLPTEWQNIIKSVNKVSGVGGGSSSGTETVSDDCFLLSEIEIFGSVSNSNSVDDEGEWYAFYKSGKDNRKSNGSVTIWWERSPASGSSNRFCVVAGNGAASKQRADTNYGLSFAFCI